MLAVVAAVWFSPPGVWLIPLAAAFWLAPHASCRHPVRNRPHGVRSCRRVPERSGPIGGRPWRVVIGVDAHKKTHTLVALDGNGRKLAEKTVEATDAGHAKALHWALLKFGDDELTWGIEDCRHVSARLERSLVDRGPAGRPCSHQTDGPVPWLRSPPGQVRSDRCRGGSACGAARTGSAGRQP